MFTFKSKILNLKSGFTLIELLVVMTIVAILVGLSLVSYQGIKKSARDGKRKTDLEQIRSALEMCRADTGSYPTTLPGNCSTYLSPVPSDPLSTRAYFYSGSANSYTLCAAMETETGIVSGCGSCGAGVTCNYKVTNP